MAQGVTVSKAILMSAVMRKETYFLMPFAMTKDEWHVHPPGAPKPDSFPARPEDHWQAWKAVQWAIENYSTKFKLPSVDIFEGSEP
jgi:hypothetical protein